MLTITEKFVEYYKCTIRSQGKERLARDAPNSFILPILPCHYHSIPGWRSGVALHIDHLCVIHWPDLCVAVLRYLFAVGS
jgi:hypothetical protein